MKAIIPTIILTLLTPISAALGQEEQSVSSSPPLSRGGRGGGVGPGRGGGGFGGGLGVDAEFTQFSGVQLPRFDLDFQAGTPGQLVAAIEKATGKPLNVIIPTEFQDTQIPDLKMKGVTVPELFQALQMASLRSEPYVSGTRTDPDGTRINNITYQNTGFGFRAPPTTDPQNPVWYFYAVRTQVAPVIERPPNVCRFYQLGPYLEKYSIDDITTAIQTGWNMMKQASGGRGRGGRGPFGSPTMNFHKETKLLIVVGSPDQLELIDSALAELSGPNKSDTTMPASKGAARP